MKRWNVYRPLWIAAGALLALALALTAGVLIWLLWQRLHSAPFDIQAVLLGCGAAITLGITLWAIYVVASGWSLFYTVDRNVLTISWLGHRWLVPMDRIQSIDRAGQHQGTVRYFATATGPRALAITTSSQTTYIISPADQAGFLSELEQRRSLGANLPVAEGPAWSRWMPMSFWRERAVRWLTGIAAALHGLLWVALGLWYQGLPAQLVLRLDQQGGLLQPRERILLLPLGMALLLLLNVALGLWLWQRNKAAALVVQGSSIIGQLLALAGIASIVLR